MLINQPRQTSPTSSALSITSLVSGVDHQPRQISLQNAVE
jgi:hypothetical protein